MPRVARLLLFFLLALAAAGRALAEGAAPAPPTATARIGRIEVETENVFDLTSDDNFIYRAGNFIHFVTEPTVVRRLLLFKEGDPLDPAILAETERNLREADQFQAALVTVTAQRGGECDVLVRTRDKWSLAVGAGAAFVGGVSKGNAEISEQNLFGWGKEIEVDARAHQGFEVVHGNYFDPDILGTRLQLSLDGALSNLGTLVSGSFGRPFISRLTPYAFSVGGSREVADIEYFERGDVAAKVREKVERLTGSAGVGTGPYESVKRLVLEVAAETAEYRAPRGFDPLAFRWPRNRQILDVVLRPSLDQFSVFEKWEKLDTDRFVEDEPIGRRFDATLGVEGRRDVLGTRPEAIVGLHGTYSFELFEKQITAIDASWLLRHDGDRPQRQEVAAFIHHYIQLPWNTLGLALSFHAILENEDLEPQLTLGEDNGLRGYPARFFTGTRQLLGHVEDRIFTPVNLLTVYLGFVVFADAGLVWTDSRNPRLADVRPSVGFGFRAFSAEVLKTRVGRLDIAFPLNRRGGGISGVSVSVSTGQVFTLFGEEVELMTPF